MDGDSWADRLSITSKCYQYALQSHRSSCAWKVKVKIIRLWKQNFSNNPWVVSSIDMVVIDEQKKGVPVLSKFGVGENKGRFLLTRHPCTINFYRHTSVRLSNDWAGPEQSFEPRPFNDILTKDFDYVYSFDDIGEVIHCQDTKVMTTKGRERRVKSLQLQNEEGIKMKCALWDEHATRLDAFLADPERKDVCVIMLVQFAKLGEWKNEPQISNFMFGSEVLD